jgi:DNA-binding NtrC family response regulator
MAHLLVSWIARNNDFHFTSTGVFDKVNSFGPNPQFHENFFIEQGLDEHILLYSNAKDEPLAERLLAYLLGKFPKRLIRTELLSISDIIDLVEVKSKIETWLLQHAKYELTLFFSPGTSVMQLAWYVCHTTLGLRTQLVQTRAGKFSPDGQPALLRFEVEHSATPVTAIIREQQLKAGVSLESEGGHFISDSLRLVYQRASQVAQTDKVTVLIRGESGTGKERLAYYVHEQSVRHKAPFRALNCAALTDTLLESRLFGYKKGSFTGADQNAEGEFKAAEGGTLFLDEIGDISPALQVTLLRVLQSDEIQPIGGKPQKVNVRVIAATHAQLEAKCEQGLFRWDLYYRLAVAELELPSLREWPTKEREALLDHLVKRQQKSLQKAQPLRLAAATRQLLLDHPFPGNVRELENLLTKLYVFAPADNPAVRPQDLPARYRQTAAANTSISLLMRDAERAHAVRVLNLYGGVKAKAAKALGMDVRTLTSTLLPD